MIKEVERTTIPGLVALLVILALLVATGLAYIPAVEKESPWLFGILVFSQVALCFGFNGLMIVNPNDAKVLVLFGKYTGSVKRQGWHWVNPFLTKARISLRVRNFETGKLKVNDKDGNPIEIAAVVVWRVTDTAEARFEVDDYVNFVHVQSESALRNLAVHYTYDGHDDDIVSLRGSTDKVAEQLRTEIQARLDAAGINVIEARISHLAYAPEIAEAMLRRQQAGAIIAARQMIVEGAVGMVEMALDELSKNQIVELDEERKASMVSNLLVVLCSDHSAQPVVNTGSLYQ